MLGLSGEAAKVGPGCRASLMSIRQCPYGVRSTGGTWQAFGTHSRPLKQRSSPQSHSIDIICMVVQYAGRGTHVSPQGSASTHSPPERVQPTRSLSLSTRTADVEAQEAVAAVRHPAHAPSKTNRAATRERDAVIVGGRGPLGCILCRVLLQQQRRSWRPWPRYREMWIREC